mmetsp:Transcript_18598/g.34436  ORF Transcript_18598/g.34436 Transcript_18598/m.34436 type:complete len:354 (-) Transcript_18598:9-1070(-)
MPPLGLLQALEPLIVVKALGLGNTLKHVLDAGHHSLETAEVDVGTILELGEDLIGVLLNLVLDVHLASLLVLLLTGEGVVQAEVVRELLLSSLELVIVEEGIRVGNTEEEPGLTLVRIRGRGVLEEQTADETTVRGNSSSSGNHDVVGSGVLLGHEHDLASRASHHHLISRRGVAKEVRADALLRRIISLKLRAPVGSTTDTKGSSLASHIVTITGRGNGVKTHRVRLAILFADTRGDHTPGLALPVREVTVMVNDDVARLTGGLGADNALGGDDLSSERGLVLVGVDRDSRLVEVRLSLEEVLLGRESREGGALGSGREGRSGGYTGHDTKSRLHLPTVIQTVTLLVGSWEH